MTSPTAGKSGWYPHPEMANTLCFWDGSAWTDRTAPSTTMPVSTTTAGDKAVKAGAAITFAVLVLLVLAFLVVALG